MGIVTDKLFWLLQKIYHAISVIIWIVYRCINSFLVNKAKRNNVFIVQTGNSFNTHREILDNLHKYIPGLKEVTSVEACDVILVFCPIVSRAGTDMEAALNKLNKCSESKPAIFMVLHHTFEREKILPDSSRFIKRGNTLTVNCLFNEDERLLKCDMNYKALDKILSISKRAQKCMEKEMKKKMYEQPYDL